MTSELYATGASLFGVVTSVTFFTHPEPRMAAVPKDVTVLVYNETAARALGAQGNQIAIFDLRRGIEIDTSGTGLPVPSTPPPAERLQQLQSEDRVEIAEGAAHDDANGG